MMTTRKARVLIPVALILIWLVGAGIGGPYFGRVGEVAHVERDAQGRTRWLNIDLDAGGQARVASFRADLDARQKLVSLRLSEDLLIARADASAIAAINSPSV